MMRMKMERRKGDKNENIEGKGDKEETEELLQEEEVDDSFNDAVEVNGEEIISPAPSSLIPSSSPQGRNSLPDGKLPGLFDNPVPGSSGNKFFMIIFHHN